ncbi:MAG TPA: undecaprenyl-diphosphate phosphatase [Bryobacteraceae bacterium]|nr:undecaprenyl-diphosphate phosphatase [Bryobacteraceae bacterium]
MPLYQAVVLAIVQALTEFLPISSQAHLWFVPWLFGWKDPGLTFDVALHAGTLIAVLIYFFRDWIQIIAHGFGINAGSDDELRRNQGLLWLLAIASIPAAVAGFFLDKQAETSWRSPYLIGGMLIGIGVLMWIAEKTGSERKSIDQVGWGDGIAIGLSQALALVPGTSRSGITITTGLFRGLTRATAARFSFLLSTPIIAGAVLKKLWDVHKEGGIPHDMQVPFAAGTAISGIAGALVIAVFLRYLRRNSLMPFVYYRIVFGIIVIALAAFLRAGAE